MRLSEKAQSMVEIEYAKKHEPLREEHLAEMDRISYLNQIDGHPINPVYKFNLHAKQVKFFIRKSLDAYVEAFTETYKFVKSYPNDDDVREISDRLFLIADNAGQYLSRLYKGVYSPIENQILAERLITLTEQQLREIPGSALLQLHSFMIKAALEEELTVEQQSQTSESQIINQNFYAPVASVQTGGHHNVQTTNIDQASSVQLTEEEIVDKLIYWLKQQELPYKGMPISYPEIAEATTLSVKEVREYFEFAVNAIGYKCYPGTKGVAGIYICYNSIF
jgi:hypothetical protein